MGVTESSPGSRRKSRKIKQPPLARVLLAVFEDVVRCAPFADLENEEAGPLVVEFRRFGVRYAPEPWLGGTSGTIRQACSRAVRQLARQGSLQRVTEPGRDRVRFLRPTAEGLLLAVLLSHGSIDQGAVIRGLSQTDWAKWSPRWGEELCESAAA